MPLVVLFALAAFQSSPHCFMTLSARTAPADASVKAPAKAKAESATRKDLLIIVIPSDSGRPGEFASFLPSPVEPRAHSPSCRPATERDMNIS